MAEKNTTYRIFEHISDVDISEQDIMDYDPVVLDKLLIDHTMSAKARAEASDQEKVVNIFWQHQIMKTRFLMNTGIS